MRIAQVIVDVPTSQVNQTFDYSIPEKYQEILSVGMRVTVPFGPRKIMGFVVGISDHSTFDNLKNISNVLDIIPVLTEELIDLGKWLAEDTVSFYITAYQAMLPQVLKAEYQKELERLTEAELTPELEQLFTGRDFISYEEFTASLISYRQLQKAIQAGDISVKYLVTSKITKKRVTMVSPRRSEEHTS